MTANEARIRELESEITKRDNTILMQQNSINDLKRQVDNLTEILIKKNRKGSVTFTVIGNSNSIVWRLYFYFQGEKYRCTGRNFFNWFPAVL